MVCAAFGLMGSLAPAQSESATNKAKSGEAASAEGNEGSDEEDDGAEVYQSNHSRYLKKIRPGSYIRRQKDEIIVPDIRGEYEVRRDDELSKHFQRLAQIDAILALARELDDGGLRSRAEAVRRREIQRYRLAMGRLGKVMATKLVRGVTP